MTKEEKTWFFLLCGHQSKINKLIFLVFLSAALCKPGNGMRFVINLTAGAVTPLFASGLRVPLRRSAARDALPHRHHYQDQRRQAIDHQQIG
ncbi:hypothetical protein EG355_08310 [Serratia marcescens]|nr:hypothetical protein EG355_08310 [Serratia marcescens]